MIDSDILITTITEGSNGSAGSGEHLPSLFEIILVDQIDSMLKPAFHHGVVALHDCLPLSSRWQSVGTVLRESWEEVYSMLIIVAQWMCIRRSNATIAEAVYGLTRRSVGTGDYSIGPGSANDAGASASAGRVHVHASSPLLKWQQDVSIWFVAVLPRLLHALKSICAKIRAMARTRRRFLQQHPQPPEPDEQSHLPEQAEQAGGGGEGAALVDNRNTSISTNWSWSWRLVSSLYPNATTSRQIRVYMGRTLYRSLLMTARIADYAVVGIAHIIPAINASVCLYAVLQKLRYLFGLTPYSHPLFALLGIALVRKQTNKHSVQRVAGAGVGGIAQASGALRQMTMASSPSPSPSSSSSSSVSTNNWRVGTLVAAVLAVRGMQWMFRNQEMHSNMHRRARAAAASFANASGSGSGNAEVGGYEVPPPPPRPKGRSSLLPRAGADISPSSTGSSNGNDNDSNNGKGTCPLCQQPHASPALSTGGYVFCYICLLSSLQEQARSGGTTERGGGGKCPVSGVPCREQDIILLH